MGGAQRIACERGDSVVEVEGRGGEAGRESQGKGLAGGREGRQAEQSKLCAHGDALWLPIQGWSC